MRNDPSTLAAPKGTEAEGGTKFVGYATLAIVLAFVVAVLVCDRRGIANATRGASLLRADYFGTDEFIGMLTDEPAIPPLDDVAWPKSRPGELEPNDRR
jgi:hypothetical protein